MVIVTGIFQGIVTLLLIGGVISATENITETDTTQREAAKTALFQSVDDNVTE